jgi:hypothetical protein
LRAILHAVFRCAVPVYRRVQTAWSVAIDWALGVRTTPGYSRPVTTPSGDRPFGWTQTARLLRRHRLGPDDVLVDIGSGAGRVVLFGAARYACRRVIGVERDDRLDAIARRNAAALRLRARTPIELVHADALEFDLPDDATVIFFFNPFEGHALDQLVAKLAASIDRNPRRVRLLYANPRSAELLSLHPRLVLVDHMRSWRPDREWARSCSVNIYDVVQASEPATADASGLGSRSPVWPVGAPRSASATSSSANEPRPAVAAVGSHATVSAADATSSWVSHRRAHRHRPGRASEPSDAGRVVDTGGDAVARIEEHRGEGGLGAGEVPLVDGVDGGASDGIGEREL